MEPISCERPVHLLAWCVLQNNVQNLSDKYYLPCYLAQPLKLQQVFGADRGPPVNFNGGVRMAVRNPQSITAMLSKNIYFEQKQVKHMTIDCLLSGVLPYIIWICILVYSSCN